MQLLKLMLCVAILVISFQRAIAGEMFCCVADFQKPTIYFPSKTIPIIQVEGPTPFKCPANPEEVLPDTPEHGEEFKCGGHTFIIWGNGIEIID